MGLIPGRNIPNSLKMVLAAPRLALRLKGRARTGQDNVTGCGMSSVWGMILQRGSTIK